MKKITVRVVVPFPVMFSSQPGRAGDGPSVFECEVMAKDEADALRKAEQRIKLSVLAQVRDAEPRSDGPEA